MHLTMLRSVSGYVSVSDNCDQPTAKPVTRRRFLSVVSIGLGTLGAAVAGVPVLGFLLGPLFRREEEEWRSIGPPDEYETGQTVKVDFQDSSTVAWSGQSDQSGAWLRRTGEQEFQALSIFCTHLGCPVLWKPDAELFLCPCHGGSFFSDGTVASGPPPIPLNQFPVRIRDGMIEVGTRPIDISTEQPLET